MATELELKLMVQSEYLKSASDFLDEICILSPSDEQSRQPTLLLMNAYFDTEEADLMQAGMALRIRAVNNQYIQTVKTRGSSRIGMHARGEWEWIIPHDHLDLSLLNEVPLPEALQNMSWASKLIEVYRTDFERQVWNIESQGSQMEVVCDQGLVTSPYGKEAICELELELKGGGEAGLYGLALQLAERVPVQVGIVSKAQKGARLKHGQIEFPQKPTNLANEMALAAYWYEVWLVYWEAMHFMKDEVLMQPLRHSMSQLARCVSRNLAQELDSLSHDLLSALVEEEEQLLQQLASMKKMGISMLRVGQWLHKQTS